MNKSDTNKVNLTLKYGKKKASSLRKSTSKLRACDYKQLFCTTEASLACFELTKAIHLFSENQEIIDSFWNLNATCIEASTMFAHSRGFDNTKEVIGRYFDYLFLPDQQYYQLIKDWVNSGFSSNSYKITEKDIKGKEKILSTNLYGVFNKNYLTKFWIVTKDITSIVVANSKIKNFEKHYLNLLKTNDCFILKTCQDNNLEYISPNLENILGIKNLNKKIENLDTFTELIHKDDLPSYLDFVKSKSITGNTSLEIKYRLKTSDENYKWFHEKAIVQYSDTEEIICWNSIIQNIQNTKILEASLIQSQKMETIGALTGGISHDINNYLTVAFGQLELLESIMSVSDRNRLIECKNALKKCADINNTLLDLGRKTLPKFSNISIFELFTSLERLLETIIPPTVLLKLSCDKNVSKIRGNFTQIEQVMLNIAINANDSMPKGGVLSIVATEEEEVLQIKIKDTGSGIPATVLNYIFDPFFTTKPSGKGTGLGLSTAKTIIESHSGEITVESIYGKGTAFILNFPKIHSKHSKSQHKKSVILLAEDDELVRKTISMSLSKRGYEVLTAKDGEEALAILKSRRIELLISDQCMPKISGTELIKAIEKHNKNFPVILTSGNLREINHKNEKVYFLKKPFLISELIQRVEELTPTRGMNLSGQL